MGWCMLLALTEVVSISLKYRRIKVGQPQRNKTLPGLFHDSHCGVVETAPQSLWGGGGGGSLQGCGTHYGMQGKNILGLHKTYSGMSRGRVKDGERSRAIKVV